MTSLRTYHLFSQYTPPPETWRLLTWALASGADQFTFTDMAMQGQPDPLCEAVRSALAPWYQGEARRPVLYNGDPDGTRVAHLWQLVPDTLRILPQYFPLGLLEYSLTTDTGWLEDPIVYRNSDLMLAAISHEQEGVLRISPEERTALGALSFDIRDRGEWVEYVERQC